MEFRIRNRNHPIYKTFPVIVTDSDIKVSDSFGQQRSLNATFLTGFWFFSRWPIHSYITSVEVILQNTIKVR